MTRVTESNLSVVNRQLEQRTPQEIIRWAHEKFGKRLAVLSAMQEAGCTICHMVAQLGLQNDVDVLFVDTGVNFPETLETIERIRREYGLNVISLKPARTMAEQTRDEGVLYLSKEGQKRCCELRKKEPLKQIIGKYDALIGSLRRGEGGKRSSVPVLALDTELNLLRVHPIFNMSREEMEQYIAANNVIVNPLHAQGYPTISCNRCTTPVLPGEPERAGRWRHLENETVYCAINPTDRKREDDGEEEHILMDAETVQRIVDFSI